MSLHVGKPIGVILALAALPLVPIIALLALVLFAATFARLALRLP